MRGESPVHDALIALVPRLRRYARMLCAESHAADDLVQDTLERACSRLAQWRPDSDLRAWVFAIMHNLFVSERRRPRHRFEVAVVDGDVVADAGAEHLSVGGAFATRSATRAAADPSTGWIEALDLERALRRLPDAQRQVLMLIAFEDLSYEQVASVLGIPVGTVMSRLSRARAQLRALLEPATRRAPATARARGAGPRLRVLK